MDYITKDSERFDYINNDLSIIQDKSGLTFTTDSYILSAFAKVQSNGTMVDLGSGNGTITLLTMARNKYKKAYAIEIQKTYIDIINKNIQINNLSDKITTIHADIRDLNSNFFNENIDIIISNPPYFKENHGAKNASDKASIARRELNGDIFDFCHTASSILKFGGLAYFVYTPERMSDLFAALRNEHLEPKRMITAYPDTKTKPCLIFVEAKKGANPGLIQSYPLIIYDSTTKASYREYSKTMQTIYDTFSTDCLFN